MTKKTVLCSVLVTMFLCVFAACSSKADSAAEKLADDFNKITAAVNAANGDCDKMAEELNKLNTKEELENFRADIAAFKEHVKEGSAAEEKAKEATKDLFDESGKANAAFSACVESNLNVAKFAIEFMGELQKLL